MKKYFIYASLLMLSVLAIFSCNDSDGDNSVQPKDTVEDAVKEYSVTGCKSMRVAGDEDFAEYVEYQSIANGNLSLKHINALFNCEPGQILTGASIKDGIIEVEEHEEFDGADCVCCYDLYLEVGPLEEKEYTVVFKRHNKEVFKFALKYDASLSGVQKVEELRY